MIVSGTFGAVRLLLVELFNQPDPRKKFDQTLSLNAPSLRNDQTNLRSDYEGKMARSSLVGTVLARRYKILGMIDGDGFKAHDLGLDQTVSVRQANLTSQRDRDTWRQKVQQIALVRDPNLLNVLDARKDFPLEEFQ